MMSTPITPADNAAPVPQQQPSTDTAEIRALAMQLTAMTTSPPGAVLSQAVVTAVDLAGTPPTATITLSGSTTPVPGVRFLSSYTPVVSDTVQVVKQSNSILILGHTADTGTASATDGGWQTPSLASGFTTNGNSNGPAQYRRVMDNGVWKVQWIGSLGHTGTSTTILSAALPANYRPSAKRSILVSRDVQGGSNVAQIDFNTDGTMSLVGATTGPSGTTGTESANHTHFLGSSDTQLSGYLSQGGSDLGHAHGLGTSYTEVYASNTHTHTLSGATVVDPTWIGLNHVEYFL